MQMRNTFSSIISEYRNWEIPIEGGIFVVAFQNDDGQVVDDEAYIEGYMTPRYLTHGGD